jgi:hypothetical protein
MKYYFLFIIILVNTFIYAQKPCQTDSNYNDFDFWVGEWEVYNTSNKLAGISKVSKILDNCVILEEWTSSNSQQGFIYSGKSLNSYNASTKQWQQNWVDNTGSSTEFLTGVFKNNSMEFISRPFKKDNKDCIRRLTFFNLKNGNIRQLGEISNDQSITFTIEYDLEYRPKK